MNYYQPIEISRWSDIIEKYKTFVLLADSKKSLDVNWHIPELERILLPDIKKHFGGNRRIGQAILCFMKSGWARDIHVDGHNVERTQTFDWAINIPILNYTDSVMKWYDGKYKLHVEPSPSGMEYLGITWEDGPYEVDSCNMIQPTIVNVATPHNVINYSDKPRLILSLRFYPDLFKT